MIRTLKIANLVRDPSLHPRQGTLSPFHVAQLSDALRAGATLPPITVDQDTRQVIGGWHRTEATLRVHGPEATIKADLRGYADDRERFEAALADSSDSKLGLTSFNQSASMLRAEVLGIPPERVAQLIAVPAESLRRRVVVANIERQPGVLVALKRSYTHLAGTTLNPTQEEVNRASDGRPARWHARQLIDSLSAGMVPLDDGEVQNLLIELRDLLITLPELQEAA